MNHLIHLLDNAPLGIYDAEKAGCPGGLTWQGKTILKPNAGSWHCSSAVFWGLCAIFKEAKIEESISLDEIKRLQDWCWSGAKFRAGGPGGLVEMDLASWIAQGEELPKTPTLEALDIVQYWRRDFAQGHAAICLGDNGTQIEAWGASPAIAGDQPGQQTIQKARRLWWVARLNPDIFTQNGGA